MEFSANFANLSQQEKDTYEIIDIRNKDSFEYGHIPGAINIPADEIDKNISKFSKTKTYYVYCRSGRTSPEVVQKLNQQGVLQFGGWIF